MNRPSWYETFMEMAVVLSKRSTCKYYKVGAVFARDKRFLTGGYNGPVSGDFHCVEVGCAKEDKDGNRLPPGSGSCRGAHAEMNGISNAANIGVKVRDSVIYITYRPCYDCAKHVINAGVNKIIYLKDYDGDLPAIELLERRKIPLIKFNTISGINF